MKYSVIIPHYNSPEQLIRCIDSVPKGEQYQIIVIDDCSSSDKVDFNYIRNSVKRPFLIEFLPSNSGAGTARNAGLKLAEGEWILFADSDDFFLRSAGDLFEKATIDTTSDIIIFNIDDKDNKSQQGQRYWKFIKEYDGSAESLINLKYRTWAPWAKLYRKEFIDCNSLNFEQRRKGNDCFFVLNAMAKTNSIEVYDVPVYHLSYSPVSLSHTNTSKWEYMYDVYDLWLWRYRFFKDNSIPLWKEYNLYYLLKEVKMSFGVKHALTMLLRSFDYRYSILDLIISKLTR